jgi:hypothetical protein
MLKTQSVGQLVSLIDQLSRPACYFVSRVDFNNLAEFSESSLESVKLADVDIVTAFRNAIKKNRGNR